MKKLMIITAACAAVLAGCRMVEVVNRGEEVVRDADGRPVMLPDGTVQTMKRGWSVYHNQHWMATEADSLTAHVEAGRIDFALNGLNARPDGTNLNALVVGSLEGAANLAAKVGAAVATSGGSAGAEAATAWVRSFVAAGGDPAKATVSCADGSCTITDGAVTCKDGSCAPATGAAAAK